MVNEITYRQLSEIAALSNKSVEEVAKERGISEKELADMKLKESDFGGTPDEPGDISAYKKVNINEIKGVLSIYDSDVQDGKIKLSAEARKELSQFGVTGLVMEDGVLYAEHQDGQKYVVGNTEDFVPDFAAVEDEKRRKAWETAANSIVNGTAKAVETGFKMLGLLHSCAPENDITAIQNGNIKIDIAIPDYSNVLQGILDGVNTIISNNNSNYKNILEELINISKNQKTTQQQLEAMFDKIKVFLNEIVNLGLDIKISNDKNAADIQALLEQILDSNKSCDTKLAEIIDLIKTLKSELLAAIEKLNQENKEVLNEIKALINNLGVKGNALVEAILIAIGKLPTKQDLSGIEALLKQIANNQSITNDKITSLTDLFNKYGEGVNAKLNTIISLLSNMPNYETYLNKIIDMLGNIKPGETKDYEAQLDAIIKLLQNLDANNDTRNQKILDAIEKLGSNMMVKLNAILAKLDKNAPDYNEKLDAIIKLLETLDANNETRNNKVLDAIEKLGAGVSANLAAILAAIKSMPQSEQKDYTDILNAILDKIKEGNAQNNANFCAVLAKIKELGVNVMYGMNAILEAIQNMPDYTEKLNVIIAKLDALGAKAQEILEAIKDHDVKITVDVTGKVTCECNCNCGNGSVHEGILGDLNDLLG